jgi:aminoglycoside phosphotransferase (APT) family kinase protein
VSDATLAEGGAPEADEPHSTIDPERLGAWMDEHGLPGSGAPLTARFITGGASNDLFEITRDGHRCALRRPPEPVPEGRNQTMLREYRLLAALRDTDVPHARVLAGCDDPSVIGGCFYLMDFVDGWSPIQEGTTWPEPFGSDLEARRGLAFQLVDGIARLSRVDWEARGLEGFGRPEGYQFANVMYHHGAPARLAAIVDWEMATVGDPLLDLGWVVNGWPDDTSSAGEGTVSYVDYTGMPTKDELLEAYALASGRPVDEIDYYVILARFKLAIVLEAGYARVVQGEADNPKMAMFGDVVLEMARKAAELASTTTLR